EGMVGLFAWRSGKDGKRIGHTVWSIFPADTSYFGEDGASFMINYRVKDLDAVMAALRKEGVKVDPKIEELEYGRFGWVVDPEGNGQEGEEGPRGQGEQDDAEDEDRIRREDDRPERRGRASYAEPDHERPLPDRGIRGDVRDLVNPQDARDEQPEGNGENDRRRMEGSREDVVHSEDRHRAEGNPDRDFADSPVGEPQRGRP